MSAHVRDLVLFGGVALYFVSAFLLLWLNPYQDDQSECCRCAFCRREESRLFASFYVDNYGSAREGA